MKTLTSQDKGKRFFLDNVREDEVELYNPLPDNDGWVQIKLPDGRIINVVETRLTEIMEFPLEKVSDEQIELDYPKKVSRLVMEIFDAETGEVTVKWLEDEDAEIWNNWMRKLCYKASELGMNPNWLALKWHEKKGTKKTT